MSKLSRRAFLGASSATALTIFVAPVRAQSGSATTVGLSAAGRINIPTSVGGVPLTNVQRSVFSSAATQIARAAPSRAAANATLSAVVRTAMTGSMRFGIYGLAAAAAIGGVYYLATGDNPVDGLLNLGLSWDGGAAGGITLSIPCDCTSVPLSSGGSYPDNVAMGFYRTSANCGTTLGYRLAVKSSNPTTSAPENRPSSEWSWGYTQTIATGSYRHFYTRTVSTSNCGSSGVNIPGNSDLEKTLTTAQKAKLLTQNALDALGVSLWTGVGKGSSWTGGGFTGGGGGSFGGGGASGNWTDSATAQKDVIAAGRSSSVAVLPSKGTAAEPPQATVGEMHDPWTPTSDPGLLEYPPEVKFPDDTPAGTPTPTPGATPTPSSGGTPTPTPTSGGIDWGPAPAQEDPSAPNPMSWMPTPFAAPSMPGSCTGVPYDFSGPLGVAARGSINPCPVLDAARPVVRPISIVGWTFYAFTQLLDL